MATAEREGVGGSRRAKAKRPLEAEDEEGAPTRGRKKKVSTPIEHRLARFVAKPSTAVRDRMSRAFTHRLYLIDKKLHASAAAAAAAAGEPPSACDFFVLGATGNVYTVKLDLVSSCTCPDHAKGNTCKHILFVMLRVLKLPPDDPRVWQKALLPSELHSLMQSLSVNDALLASSQVRQRFKQITGDTPTVDNTEALSLKPGQREIDGDCPICYEPMASSDGKPLEPVVFCKTCGNNVHADCFKRWSQSKKYGHVTCIYCRAVWESDTKVEDMLSHHGDYMNLASFSDEHGPENTSIEALYPVSYQWWKRYR